MRCKNLMLSMVIVFGSLFSNVKADTIYGITGYTVPELQQAFTPNPFVGSLTVNDTATGGNVSIYVPATSYSKSFDFTMITNIPSVPPIGQSVRIFGDTTLADNTFSWYDWNGTSGLSFDGTGLLDSLGNGGWDAFLLSLDVLGTPLNLSVSSVTSDVPPVNEPTAFSLLGFASVLMFGVMRSMNWIR